jgi:hypothetical protein
MDKPITSFVGLDVHQDSTAIGVADAGREAPRFLGTVGPDVMQLLKALKSLGNPTACWWCTRRDLAATSWYGNCVRAVLPVR